MFGMACEVSLPTDLPLPVSDSLQSFWSGSSESPMLKLTLRSSGRGGAEGVIEDRALDSSGTGFRMGLWASCSSLFSIRGLSEGLEDFALAVYQIRENKDNGQLYACKQIKKIEGFMECIHLTLFPNISINIKLRTLISWRLVSTLLTGSSHGHHKHSILLTLRGKHSVCLNGHYNPTFQGQSDVTRSIVHWTAEWCQSTRILVAKATLICSYSP